MDYDKLIDLIYEAYYDCRKNKKRKKSSIEYSWEYEKNLNNLTSELLNGTYKPTTSIVFPITRPKLREIFAANFKDRIVHHLIINKFGKIIDNEMIEDSYNCRKGKGLFYGINRLKEEIERLSENYTKEVYVLNGDIEGFFMSIDKNKLWQMLEYIIRDNYKESDIEWWLRLFKIVIMHRPELDCIIHGDANLLKKLPNNKTLFRTNGKGLPIGNLPSQICGNLYRTPFDKKIIGELNGKGFYCVFVDDFRIVSCNKKLLQKIAVKAKKYLKEYLGLTLHRKKFSITKCKQGVKFTGYIIKPWGIYTGNRIVNNAFHVFSLNKPIDNMLPRYNSYMGFLIHSKSYAIRWNLFKSIPNKSNLVCINMKKYNKLKNKNNYD